VHCLWRMPCFMYIKENVLLVTVKIYIKGPPFPVITYYLHLSACSRHKYCSNTAQSINIQKCNFFWYYKSDIRILNLGKQVIRHRLLLISFLLPLSEWFNCLMQNEQFFSYIIARTSYILTRWWCLLCTRPTHLVGFL
jgi:hypothetical protein